MSDLITRLLALAEKAVDEAMQFEYGDPEDRYIYRELQELRQLVQNQPNDLSHLSEQEFNALAPQGYHATGPADSELEWPTDEDLYDLAEVFNGDPVPAMRRALKLWGRPAIEPVPVSERLPGAEDCDSEGRCWWFSPSLQECWWYQEPYNRAPNETHWLPYHALPLPTK
jgi:hypothetical protein